VEALTRLPRSCLTPALTYDIADEVRLGEMIFNSPALLGGQAEKKGLSCGSCHRNGRGNPEFQFEAISGAPGTADVTSGLFSKARADNTFNPVPIPDLAQAEGRDQVDRTDRAALAVFVRGQIEDEFSGDTPSDEVFEPLLTYLQFIDARRADCFFDRPIEASWTRDWSDAELAATKITTAGDSQTRAFYIRTARLSLGRIHSRYISPEHADIRDELIEISRALGSRGAWPEDTGPLQAQLAAAERTSLYDAQTLANALQLAGKP